ncbi:MAG TPA: M28 family metallopeptidase [Solirubrobacteraceae bacterium]|nr:M28 family metallopeptidase [Solirubrobacteraceae bacterium]
MALRPLVALLAVQLLIGAALVVWGLNGFPLPGQGEPAAAEGRDTARAVKVDRFDAARALRFARLQVEQIGPRPAGSPASARLAALLRDRLPRGRFESIPGHPGLRNVVGRIPGRSPAVLVGAHFDTEARPRGHVGANDGAAGTAAVLELARALKRRATSPEVPGSGERRRSPPPREVRFVLFDGEEEPAGCEPFVACGLRGSTGYARRHAAEVGDMVLLDYIAERRGLRFEREANSDPGLWAQLRAAARRVGTTRWFPARDAGVTIIDDHVPFVERGVPAIDLIDFDYPQRDSLDDDMSAISARSLDVTGETVMELVLGLRRQR